MALSQLDERVALVLIDLQKGIVANAAAAGASGVVSRAAELARGFRERGLPVILVNVAGKAPGRTEQTMNMASLPPDWTELMPELEAAETDVRLTKRAYGAFLGAGLEMPLDAELRSRGVTQIVLAGISTSVGVESTARSAYDLGYNVVFVTDAMTDRDPEAHRFTVEKIFPRLGERASTAEVLEKLQR